MAAWAASAPQRHARARGRPGDERAGDDADGPRHGRRGGRVAAEPGPSAHVSGPSGNAPSVSGASSSPPSAPPGNGSSPRPRPRRTRPGRGRSPTRPSATAPTSGTPPPATGSPSSPPRWTPPATRSRPPWRPSAPPRPPPATRPAARPRRPSAPPAPAAAWSSSPTGLPASRHVRHRECALHPPASRHVRRAKATFGAPGGPADACPRCDIRSPIRTDSREHHAGSVASHGRRRVRRRPGGHPPRHARKDDP